MAPDLRIRNVDTLTHERLVARARASGRSVEAEMRVLLADALGNSSAVAPADWERHGFEQVEEIVPGRVYDAWALGEHYRISISRAVLNGSMPWSSEIDKVESIGSERVWTSPTGIPARHFGATAEVALRDAMRWLAEWGGFNKLGRARRDAAEAAEMDPGLRAIADAIDELFGSHAQETWRDRTRARWSTEKLDFFISRSGGDVALMTYVAGSTLLAFTPAHFLMVTDAARKVVDEMHRQLDSMGESAHGGG
jgi:hypothetical protein